ncbi:MAG: tRNA 2-thiouridine(34) synthase MnmA [Bradymonadales bacterium]
MSRVAIALSGGVDSSLAAKILLEAGHEVIAVTMKLQNSAQNSSSCAGDAAIAKARAAAQELGIPFHVCDISNEFKDIILKYAWNDYKNARTPSPCVFCNERIKFGKLWQFAQNLACKQLATGHYARIEKRGERHVLCRGVDKKKDQSYFLAGLCSETLANILFPLGGMEKEEVRRRAEHFALLSAQAPDSQNVCIVEEGRSFAQTLADIFGEEAEGGYFVDGEGRKIKAHRGLHHYTVGQRHGLGNLIPTKAAWVKEIRRPNVVITTQTDELLRTDCSAHELVWNCDEIPQRVSAQIRYRHRAQEAFIDYNKDEDLCKIQFSTPVRAVSPGQIIVFYDGDIVLGRGILL